MEEKTDSTVEKTLFPSQYFLNKNIIGFFYDIAFLKKLNENADMRMRNILNKITYMYFTSYNFYCLLI